MAEHAEKHAYPDLGGSFTPLYRRLESFGVAERIVHVDRIGPRGRSADFLVDDPDRFVAGIRGTGRFCEDTPAGRILHRNKACWREDVQGRSLHVAVGSDGWVAAHLDRYSPVAGAGYEGKCRYSFWRVIVHNLARVVGDLVRLVFGHRVDCAPLLLSLPGRGEAPVDVAKSERALPVATSIPFSGIDEAVDGLDRHDEPWSIHWEVRVGGRLDPGRLAAAVQAAAAAHPMARAHKAHGRVGSPAWMVSGDLEVPAVSVADCSDAGSLSRTRARFMSESVPLTAPPPFRLVLARGAESDVLLMNASHVAMDSFGALRLLRSIARNYAGEADAVAVGDPLQARAALARHLRADRATRVARFRVLGRKLIDLVAVPARVAPSGGEETPGYGIHQRKMALPEHIGATTDSAVNDLLVSALHLTVALWNIEHGRRCGRVSILSPVNLRLPQWRDELVANLSVLARTVSSPVDRSLYKVVSAVRTQNTRMEAEGSLAALLEILGREARLPARARRAIPVLLAATGNRWVDSAAIAYLGRPQPIEFIRHSPSDATLWFSPPARMPLGISIGAVVSGRSLDFSFRYRYPLMNEAGACRFADHYLALLGHLFEAAGGGMNGAPTPGMREA